MLRGKSYWIELGRRLESIERSGNARPLFPDEDPTADKKEVDACAFCLGTGIRLWEDDETDDLWPCSKCRGDWHTRGALWTYEKRKGGGTNDR
jgi:hypothetical protein